jgi:hypothetical protein
MDSERGWVFYQFWVQRILLSFTGPIPPRLSSSIRNLNHFRKNILNLNSIYQDSSRSSGIFSCSKTFQDRAVFSFVWSLFEALVGDFYTADRGFQSCYIYSSRLKPRVWFLVLKAWFFGDSCSFLGLSAAHGLNPMSQQSFIQRFRQGFNGFFKSGVDPKDAPLLNCSYLKQ